jgi:predicted RNase H-like HicB family nuclease
MHPKQDITPSGAQANKWPEQIKISIWLVDEGGDWSALASEFDVVGKGATREAALQNLGETLGSYLGSYLQQGASFKEALRPIPWRENLRLRISAAHTALKEHLPRSDDPRHHPDGASRSVQHAQQDLAPSSFAHC